MKRNAIRASAVMLMLFSSSSMMGGPKLHPSDSVLKGVLLSALFKNFDSVTLSCELTAYCAGACCNSEVVQNKDGTLNSVSWANRIAAGSCTINQLHDAGIDIAAVDRSRIPFGSVIEYDGRFYAALDCGGMIKGEKIDLSMYSHSEANLFGRRRDQPVKVYIPADPAASVRAILSLCR